MFVNVWKLQTFWKSWEKIGIEMVLLVVFIITWKRKKHTSLETRTKNYKLRIKSSMRVEISKDDDCNHSENEIFFISQSKLSLLLQIQDNQPNNGCNDGKKCRTLKAKWFQSNIHIYNFFYDTSTNLHYLNTRSLRWIVLCNRSLGHPS